MISMSEGNLILLYIFDIISLNNGPIYTIQKLAYSAEHPLCTARSKLRAHSTGRVNRYPNSRPRVGRHNIESCCHNCVVLFVMTVTKCRQGEKVHRLTKFTIVSIMLTKEGREQLLLFESEGSFSFSKKRSIPLPVSPKRIINP